MITLELKSLSGFGLDGEAERIGATVREHAVKLFGALTIIRKSDTISDFMFKNVSDQDLPLSSSRLSELTRMSSECDGILTIGLRKQRTRSAGEWTSWELEEFCRVQWWLLAPVFTFASTGKLEHYEFDEACVLPFIESHEKHQGGFSEVRTVKIHPAHQKLSQDEVC